MVVASNGARNGSAAGSSKRYRNPEYICRMSDSIHHYYLTTTWKGNRGTGTSDVGAYDRLHTVEVRENRCRSRPITPNTATAVC